MFHGVMIPLFTAKKEFRIRQDMLRGVYEENLFILGRGRPALSRRRSFLLKGILLSAAFSVFAILMPDQHTGSSFIPAKPIAPISTIPVLLPTASVSAELSPKLDKYPLLPAVS